MVLDCPVPETQETMRRFEVAYLLQCSERHVERITVPNGTLPCHRVGRVVRYIRNDVLKWLEQQAQ